MNKGLKAVLAATTLVAGLMIPTSAAQAAPCGPVTSHSLISNTWERNKRFYGGTGWFGCPTGWTKYTSGAVVQRFENGAIAYSPRQGHKMLISGHRKNGYIQVEWGSTAPFSYDFFIVRWDSSGDSGQYDVIDTIGGPKVTRSTWSRRFNTNGKYRIVVEGCDIESLYPRIGNAECKQGWTIPIFV